MFNKMCEIGAIPDNLVISSNENENGLELKRNGEVFFLKDEGDDGYVIELEDSCYWNDLNGYAKVNFKSYDDFKILLEIDSILHHFYCVNCRILTFYRKDEKMFYHELKYLEKLVDKCKEMEIGDYYCDYHVLFLFFEGINRFMREYVKGFNHENKKMERKINVIAKKLIKVTDLPPWFKY